MQFPKSQTKPKHHLIEMTDVRELATSHDCWYLAKVSIYYFERKERKDERERASDTHTHKVQQKNDAYNVLSQDAKKTLVVSSRRRKKGRNTQMVSRWIPK